MNDESKKAPRRGIYAAASSSDRHVVPRAGGWSVKKEGSGRTTSTHPTQSAAVRAAREIVAKQGGGEVVIHSRDGRIRESFTLGRDSYAMISAVEGIRLSKEARRDFQEFDRNSLSSSERRDRIRNKYGKKPA